MATPHLHQFLADGSWAILLNPVTPVLTLAAYAPYAWLISSKIEKDATTFNLNRGGYGWINPALLGGGILAVAVGLLVPFAGWLVTLLLEIGILYGYWSWRDRQVPAGKQFRLSMITDLKAMADDRKAKRNAASASVVFLVGKGDKAPVPGKDDPMLEVHLAAERVLGDAIGARATRTQLQAVQGAVGIVDVVDSIPVKREQLPPELGGKAMDYIKKHAGLDVAERRRRQVGKVSVQSSLGTKELTVTTVGTTAGQVMRIDYNRDEQLKRSYDALGLSKHQLALLEPSRDLPGREGIILLCAPPGFGLTTMAYAMLSRHDAFTSSVKTLERSVDLRLDGVDQVQFDPVGTQSDFPTTLRSIIRRGPDVVFASDVSEPGTAKVISDASSSTVLLYAGLPVDGVLLGLTAWVKAVGSAGDAARGLKAVVAQRLVRAPCPACKVMAPCSAEQAKRLGVPAGKTIELARATGKVLDRNVEKPCEVCRGSGYFGLTGILEVMPLDDAARKFVSKGDLQGAYQHARRELKMMLMQEAALLAVREGRTTIEDVARAFSPPKPAAARAAGAPAPPAKTPAPKS